MTTAKSPLPILQRQATTIAKALKAAERGEDTGATFGDKLTEARANDSITFAVAMDDKILKITMAWETIREASEQDLAATILSEMRESRAL